MNMMTRISLVGLAVAGSLLVSSGAHAQVIVHGTRQVFPGDQDEITVRTQNVGTRTSLVQAWVDDGDKLAGPEELKTPFVLSPSIYRLDPEKSQVMRVRFLGADLPQDRESMYWLNLLDIPPTPEAGAVASGNYLQFSVRTRIKMIYRPKGLKQAAAQAPMQLQWSVEQTDGRWLLKASNPTPYYVSFGEISLRTPGREFAAKEAKMVAPMSSETYAFDGLTSRPTGNIRFTFINDQGGVLAQSVPVPGI